MTAPKKRGPGRPKGSTRGRTKPETTTVGVRVSAAQRAALDAAVPTGWTLAEWARETLLRAAGRADLTEAARLAAPAAPA